MNDAATERAGLLAFKSSSCRVALAPTQRLTSNALVGSSFLALRSVLVCLLFLEVLGFVAIGLSISYTFQLRPEKAFGRQIALIANSIGLSCSPLTRVLNSTTAEPREMVLMIAGDSGANYWPTLNAPTL